MTLHKIYKLKDGTKCTAIIAAGSKLGVRVTGRLFKEGIWQIDGKIVSGIGIFAKLSPRGREISFPIFTDTLQVYEWGEKK